MSYCLRRTSECAQSTRQFATVGYHVSLERRHGQPTTCSQGIIKVACSLLGWRLDSRFQVGTSGSCHIQLFWIAE